MRLLGVILGLVSVLVLAAPATATVFVIGPGMIGHPGADDPSVGYSSPALNEKLVPAESALAPGGSGVSLAPGMNEGPGHGKRLSRGKEVPK